MRRVPVSEFPELDREFASDLNSTSPSRVGKSDRRLYWWRCHACDTTWQASPASRVIGYSGCPTCADRINHGDSLMAKSPQLAALWRPELNEGKTALEVKGGDFSRKFKWRTCEDDRHIYESTIGERVRSTKRFGTEAASCPICLNRVTITGVNDLATTHPEISAELIAGGNEGIDATKINSGNGGNYWWKCADGHRYQLPLRKRTYTGQDCPYCTRARVLTGQNDLATVNPEVALTWHPTENLPVKVGELSPWSNKKYFWLCVQGHKYQATVARRSEGKGCPYCANTKVLNGFNDLATVRPDLALEFDVEKNKIEAAQIVAGSSRSFWWICQEGHTWRQKPAARLQGRGCPDCALIGFHPNRAAQFYFIVHDQLRAGKVGITNIEAREIRLKRHAVFGWRIVWEVTDESGHKIRDLERQVLRWIREDLGLPPYLGKQEMLKTGGWTETFSIDGLAREDLISRARQILSEID